MTYQPSPDKPLGPTYGITCPNWQIGQKVIYCPREYDFLYWKKVYKFHLVKRDLETWNRIRKDQKKKTTKTLPLRLKARIEKIIGIFSDSFNNEVEIAGIIAESGFNVDTYGFNACYLAGVRGACGPTRRLYQICMYYKEGNNTCAIITGIPVGGEYDFKAVTSTPEKTEKTEKPLDTP